MTLKIPRNLEKDSADIERFMQEMINRLAFGQYRYGSPGKEGKYMTRLGLEFKDYKKVGCREQLLNIANYCWLEQKAPENKKHHVNNYRDSVTRGKI